MSVVTVSRRRSEVGTARWRLLLLTGGCYLTMMVVVAVVVVRSGGCRRC